MAHDLENDESPPLSPTSTSSQTLDAHRQYHNPSKLPAFRFADLKKRLHLNTTVPSLLPSPDNSDIPGGGAGSAQRQVSPHARQQQGTTSPTRDESPNTTTCSPIAPCSPPKNTSSSQNQSVTPLPPPASYFPLPPLLPQSVPRGSVISRVQDKRSRRAPASHSSNGIETSSGPPPALSTQRSFIADSARNPVNPTTEWALAQQELALQSTETGSTANIPTAIPIDIKESTTKPRNPRAISKSLDESASPARRIPPIRSFRSSATRTIIEMATKGHSRYEGASEDQENDRDATLRALEGGFSDEEILEQRRQMNEQRRNVNTQPSTEDLFLNLARDDQNGDASNGARRRSRIALASHRQSLPPTSSTFQLSGMTPMPRRGSDLQRTSPPSAELPTYGRDRANVTSPTSQTGLTRSKYTPAASQSSPSTPKTLTGREPSFQSALSYGGRRPSIPDTNANTPQRLPGYRQSNLSYGTARVYNSSPLVGRTMDVGEGPETPRVAEGTESTASTTAPSTVWDELDDLKSRIRKLELTGKLPSTSGAAVSHATGDRPPTATTTITTMSTSPKRGRGLSASPISNETGSPTGEVHPLLHSALAKTKTLLSAEVYKALEATASDALTIAAMMGTAGQPGPISSSQSTIGGPNSTAAERQLRRKADSMCRSLTELCLALSDEPTPQPASQALVRAGSQDREYKQESPRVNESLSRVKSAASPRTLSRLEARRSSILGNNSLPSPRYSNPSSQIDGSATPSQSSLSARRTSLLIRNRRAGTEELDDDETRFRAPSRATTDVGRIRNPPREYTSREEPPPLPDNRAGSVQSSLPVRRHYASTSLNGGHAAGQMPMRYLDRSTPERNTTSVVSKLAEERGQRVGSFEPRSSALGRAASLGRQRYVRASEAQSSESNTIGTTGGYQ